MNLKNQTGCLRERFPITRTCPGTSCFIKTCNKSEIPFGFLGILYCICKACLVKISRCSNFTKNSEHDKAIFFIFSATCYKGVQSMPKRSYEDFYPVLQLYCNILYNNRDLEKVKVGPRTSSLTCPVTLITILIA